MECINPEQLLIFKMLKPLVNVMTQYETKNLMHNRTTIMWSTE